jgi:hypothetical protein
VLTCLVRFVSSQVMVHRPPRRVGECRTVRRTSIGKSSGRRAATLPPQSRLQGHANGTDCAGVPASGSTIGAAFEVIRGCRSQLRRVSSSGLPATLPAFVVIDHHDPSLCVRAQGRRCRPLGPSHRAARQDARSRLRR